MTTAQLVLLVKSIDRRGMGYNLVSLPLLRTEMAQNGCSDRKAQDALIFDGIRSGFLCPSALEGRHGTTQRERDAGIPQPDGSRWGFLSIRNS